MPLTPAYDLPYPDPDDTPDVPYHVQQLAEATEALVQGHSSGRSFWDARTVTTDASGFVTVTHGAGFTPTVALAMLARATGALYADIVGDTLTATTVRLRILDNGTPAASVSGIPIFLFLGE